MAAEYTYDVDQLAASALFRVRRAIGDTNVTDAGTADFADQEIAYAITANDDDETAAAIVLLDQLSRKYARAATVAAGSQRINLSDIAKAYERQAAQLRDSSGVGNAPIDTDAITRIDGYSSDVDALEVISRATGDMDAPYGDAPW